MSRSNVMHQILSFASTRRPTPRPTTSRRLVGILCVVLGLTLVGFASSAATEEPALTASKVDPLIVEIDAFIAKHSPDKSHGKWKSRLKKPPVFKFDQSKTYIWKLETNQGEMRFRLFDDVAPMHVSSTLYLTRLGFFGRFKFSPSDAQFHGSGWRPRRSGDRRTRLSLRW